jgi:hypothetical protein
MNERNNLNFKINNSENIKRKKKKFIGNFFIIFINEEKIKGNSIKLFVFKNLFINYLLSFISI